MTLSAASATDCATAEMRSVAATAQKLTPPPMFFAESDAMDPTASALPNADASAGSTKRAPIAVAQSVPTTATAKAFT